MAWFETWFKNDLAKPINVVQLQGVMFNLDNLANKIGVELEYNGQPAALEGTIAGYVIRNDGTTLNLTTNTGKEGNKAWVILPQEAYTVEGPISIVIKLVYNSAETTIGACAGYVTRSRTSSEIAPTGTVIPSLASLEAAIAAANAAAANAADAVDYIAPTEEERTASAPHAVGSYFIYDGKLMNATSAIAQGATIVPYASGVTNFNCAEVPDGLSGSVYNINNTANAAANNAADAQQLVAKVESMAGMPTSVATMPHATGSYFVFGGVLYEATDDIAVGDPIVTTGTGANAAQVPGGVSGQVADLKSAVNATRNGSTVKTKVQVQADYTEYSTGYIYKLDNLVIGESKIEDITTSGSGNAVAYIIPFDKATKSIKYPVFKTSGNYGCFIFDSTDTILWMYAETTANTGMYKTVDIPQNATYMLFSVPNSLGQLDWNVEIESYNVADIGKEVNDNTMKLSALTDGYTVTKQEVNQTPNVSINTVYKVEDSIGKQFTSVTTATLTGAFAKSINIAQYKFIEYTVFKSSSDYGCLMLDENDIVVWAYAERQKDTGETIRVLIPQNAVRMIWTISPTLSSMDYSYTLFLSIDNFNSDLFVDENKNLCLAGIKTDILTNKIPYHRGFLFHKLQNNDNSLWYGNNFANIYQIGVAEFNPTFMRFAISPKDGRIIAVQRDTRNGIWVWDGETTTHIDNFTVNPMAWLYNSGVDFINDGSGNEYCVFAEYTSSPSSDLVLNVWRGVYPYTSASNWSIVLSQTSGHVDIGHFHMVRRDPWTNILYCTSGDSSTESKWWYSTDYGATWALLVSGAETGWGNSTCRTINFIFTADYVYWATDHGENEHALFRIARVSGTGVLDISTKTKLTDLPGLRATNSLCYVESPNGLFMYDRVDTTPTSEYGEPVTMQFWDFTDQELKNVVTLGLTSETWGGSRGKCYVNYTNTVQPMPAMGFSIETPCIFDLVCDNPSNIGTIAFDVGSKTVRTVNS